MFTRRKFLDLVTAGGSAYLVGRFLPFADSVLNSRSSHPLR
jgi:hypothetical protein